MNCKNLVLVGEKIKLIPLNAKYREELYKYMDEEVTTFMYPIPAKNISETDEFLNRVTKKIEDNLDYTFIVLKKDTEEFLGCGGVHLLDKDIPEFGIWIKKEAHGNHYGFDAIHTSYQYFKPFYSMFCYPVDKDNIASKKIPLKLGGYLEKSYDEYNFDQSKLLHIEEYWVKGEKDAL